MATIKEVAKRARVSVGTVSNVMSGAVSVSAALRERVERAARELSYQPNHVARSLKSRKTQTLGMVISDITNPFFPLMVRGAEDAAVKRGYLLNIFNTDDHVEREQTVFAMLRVRRVDGVLAVVAPHSSKPAHLQQMIDAGTPLVCLDRLPPGLQVDAVVVDNAKGAAMCVRHLLSMGHRLIGMISGSSALQTARERVNGYRKALSEAGIPFNPDLLREGDFRLESGYRLAKDLILGNPRPTVLFVANGLMGMGAIKAILEAGLEVPYDIEVIGAGNVHYSDILRVPLSTIDLNSPLMGERAASLLMELLEPGTPRPPQSISIPFELIARESSKAAIV